MQDNLSDRQKINAELAARSKNTKSSKILKNHIPQEELDGLKILFNCECADPDCAERVSLTLEEYDKIHKQSGHFVIVKGHKDPGIEVVRADNDNVQIVEKFALS